VRNLQIVIAQRIMQIALLDKIIARNIGMMWYVELWTASLMDSDPQYFEDLPKPKVAECGCGLSVDLTFTA